MTFEAGKSKTALECAHGKVERSHMPGGVAQCPLTQVNLGQRMVKRQPRWILELGGLK